MSDLVSVLCALTSLACATLLWRGFRRTHARLLLWSALAFAFMTAGNAFLVLDVAVFPALDLSLLRVGAPLVGVACLVYGLVWEGR